MKPWRKFLALSRTEQRLLLRAVVLTAATALALRVVPFSRWRDSLERQASVQCPPDRGCTIDAIVFATGVAARYLHAGCLVQAIVGYRLMNRYGYSPRMHIGVKAIGRAAVDAHAWLEAGGQVVLGGAAAPSQYQRLLTLPSALQ